MAPVRLVFEQPRQAQRHHGLQRARRRRRQPGQMRGDARAAALRDRCARCPPARTRLTTWRTADSAPADRRRRFRRRRPATRSAPRSSAPNRAWPARRAACRAALRRPRDARRRPEYGPALANDGSAIAPSDNTSITASTVGLVAALRDGFVFAAAHVTRRGHRRAERIDVGEHVAILAQTPQVAAVRHHDGPGAARHHRERLALAIHEKAQIRRVGVVNAAGHFAVARRVRSPRRRLARMRPRRVGGGMLRRHHARPALLARERRIRRVRAGATNRCACRARSLRLAIVPDRRHDQYCGYSSRCAARLNNVGAARLQVEQLAAEVETLRQARREGERIVDRAAACTPRAHRRSTCLRSRARPALRPRDRQAQRRRRARSGTMTAIRSRSRRVAQRLEQPRFDGDDVELAPCGPCTTIVSAAHAPDFLAQRRIDQRQLGVGLADVEYGDQRRSASFIGGSPARAPRPRG